MNQHPHQLPDGRHPIRYGRGNTAVYIKSRGEGTVTYTFSMIRYMQTHRRRKPADQVKAIRKRVAEQHKQEDPAYFERIGRKGGKVTKDDRKNRGNTQSQRLTSREEGR